MSRSRFEIRAMRRQDLDLVLEWAAREGWNPGLDDAECFSATDPDGLLMGFRGEEPIAAISAVAYDDNFGFLGLYIVVPAHRGQGYGTRLFRAALDHFADRTIGLDGVVAQQDNYRRSAFTLAHINMRYGGTVQADMPKDAGLTAIADLPFDRLLALDRAYFPASRQRFVECWCRSPRRRGFALVRDGEVAGYAMIRPCREGHRIGPLFASDEGVADALFRALVAGTMGRAPVFVDVPAPNGAAAALARRYGLQPMFETARMYRGPHPALPVSRIYGITTLELG